MKKQKKRAARKRMEKRRERRGQRHAGAAPHGPAPEGHPALRTWASDPLAMAVSGRCSIVTQVESRSGTWLVGTLISLLGGGYLATFDRRVRSGSSPERMEREISSALSGEWSMYLRPAPVSLASRLVWGALAYSMGHGLVSTDELDALPALGYLPPPPGNPATWSADFVRRFEPSQIAIADAVAGEILEARARGEPDDGSVLSDLLIVASLESEIPLSTWSEIERRPGEFVHLLTGGQFDMYQWVPWSSRILDLTPRPVRGLVRLFRSGRIDVLAPDAASAADLAMRLKELIPPLRLRTCYWERGQEESEDASELLADEGVLLVDAAWPPLPHEPKGRREASGRY